MICHLVIYNISNIMYINYNLYNNIIIQMDIKKKLYLFSRNI